MREQKRKYRVVFVPDPVCWTEVPESVKVLRRQRARWHRGLVQSLWQHKRILCNPRYGTLGTIDEGGYADVILVDGNPLESLDALIRDNVRFVMKDGVVYKNTLN